VDQRSPKGRQLVEGRPQESVEEIILVPRSAWERVSSTLCVASVPLRTERRRAVPTQSVGTRAAALISFHALRGSVLRRSAVASVPQTTRASKSRSHAERGERGAAAEGASMRHLIRLSLLVAAQGVGLAQGEKRTRSSRTAFASARHTPSKSTTPIEPRSLSTSSSSSRR